METELPNKIASKLITANFASQAMQYNLNNGNLKAVSKHAGVKKKHKLQETPQV